ncbi:TIGR02186 family protein [Pararhizobium haloflavum]|uniref:TIGR02186 family protein n=1 Tax=Pararhizobium haloflavum TaxID=2037914 RepID=UPI000C17701E|nr:TIGR02186 family protein [Pararhizobium haloflavum]
MRLILAVAALLAGLSTAGAQAPNEPQERLDIGVSTNEIAITSDFSGADITVFGALDSADPFLLDLGEYDIVVALVGPQRETTVWRKERVLGIWINRRSMEFEPVAASYSLSSTRPVDLITDNIVLDRYEIGTDNIRLVPTGSIGDGSNIAEFRDALRRLKRQNGLFERDPHGVDFVSSSLFRASIRIPANVPLGEHTIRAYLFKSGNFIMERDASLRVVKTGLEQFIYAMAYERSFLYGLFAVAIAMLTGWLGSVIFRKN